MASPVNTPERPPADQPPAPRPAGFAAGLVAAARLAGQSWKWLKWPVGLGILAWLYYRNQKALAEIAAAPKNWNYAVFAFGLVAGSTLVTFLRWYLLVRAQGFAFRKRDAIRYGFVGLMTNYIAPGSVGGDLFKAVLLARDQSSRRFVAVATVLLDRILGLLALFMVGVVATMLPHDFPDSPEVKANTAVLWIGTLAGLTGLVLMLIPAITRWDWVNRLSRLPLVGHIIGELIHGVELYQAKPLAIFGALGLSLVGHAGLITGFYFCARWMQQPWVPDLAAHFCFMPNAELVGVLGMTPGGVGALEWAVEKSYVLVNPGTVPEAQARVAGLMAAIAFRVVTLTITAIGAGYYFSSRREISQALEEAAHVTDAPPAPD